MIAELSGSDLAFDDHGRPIDMGARRRTEAAEALGRLDTRPVSALAAAVHDPAPAVRIASTRALAAARGPAAVRGLCEAALRTGEADAETRTIAVTSLREHMAEGGDESAELIAQLLLERDGHPAAADELAVLACRALDRGARRRIVDRALFVLGADSPEARARAQRVLTGVGPDAFDMLIAALGDARLSRQVLPILGALRDPRASEAVAARLRGGDVPERVAAARALELIQDARAVPALLAASTDSEHAVRAASLRALDAVGPIAAVAAMVQIANTALQEGEDHAPLALPELTVADDVDHVEVEPSATAPHAPRTAGRRPHRRRRR